MAHELDNMIVAVVSGEEITRATLLVAFNLVANATNWKAPIDATIAPAIFRQHALSVGIVREAVKFFAGCEPTIVHDASGLRVRAVGYYVAVGA